jgi:hypothetical protein
MTDLKLCKDCKYSGMSLFMRIMSIGEEPFLKCHNPNLIEINLVDGGKQTHFCSTMRIFGCNKEGKYFEEKARK